MQSWLMVIDVAINLHHCCVYTLGTFVCFSDVLTLILGGERELNSSEMGVLQDNNAVGLESKYKFILF